MLASPPHNRKLGLIGVALVEGRFGKAVTEALDSVRDEIEEVLVSSGYLEGAPFSWVTISVRFSLKNDEQPMFESVSKKYGDLPMSIEVEAHELLRGNDQAAVAVFKRAVLIALIAAAKKYSRPSFALEQALESPNKAFKADVAKATRP